MTFCRSKLVSYISDKQQLDNVNGGFTDGAEPTRGALQSFVLAPLLFIIDVEDTAQSGPPFEIHCSRKQANIKGEVKHSCNITYT